MKLRQALKVIRSPRQSRRSTVYAAYQSLHLHRGDTRFTRYMFGLFPGVLRVRVLKRK